MPAENDNRLSGLQLALMRVLWERGEATVNDVHAALEGTRGLAPTTVATLLRRLEKRGLVDHRTEGRQFVYRALASADAVGRTMVSDLVDGPYAGRTSALFAHLLDTEAVDAADLAHIKRLIADREKAENDQDAGG